MSSAASGRTNGVSRPVRGEHCEPSCATTLRRAARARLRGPTRPAVLLLIAASMLLGALEQIRDRARLMAVLVAFGTRRRTLAGSVLWQTVLPVGLGLLVAALIGTTLGTTLLGLLGRPVFHDWNTLLAMAGIGAAVSVGVTLLTLPTLWRAARPRGCGTSERVGSV
ncbi:FtsX-like permease family protein [Streptomyces sp. NPDC010273]|uniref:FtsX-like permease family protein n=1 Tax=Streptomyces sp. NPDC010273 TaxID=3364829 RepID=UPI0036EA7812